MMRTPALLLPALLCLASPARSEDRIPINPFGLDDPMIGRPAPELEVSEWINGKGTTLRDLRGKVVVLEFFQMWCPGCNKFSLPLMKEWTREFAGEKDVEFISVHTVFEGFLFQSPGRLRKFVKKKGIRRLVGIDRRLQGEDIPVTMRRYRTGGTPCMAVVDKNGIVRFKHFGGFRKEPVAELIRTLIREKVSVEGKKT